MTQHGNIERGSTWVTKKSVTAELKKALCSLPVKPVIQNTVQITAAKYTPMLNKTVQKQFQTAANILKTAPIKHSHRPSE